MKSIFFVYMGSEITEDLLSLMSFAKKKYKDKTIVFVLVKPLNNSLIEVKKIVDQVIPFTEKIIASKNDVIVFQNTNYNKIKNDLEKGVMENKIIKLFMPGAFFLTESDVFRNDKTNFFTFSPFQDTQPFFLSLNNGSSIKKQLCIRYINKGDLTYPLFMSVHNCYSFQHYLLENQCNTICSVIDVLSKEYLIDKDRIVIQFPKSCEVYLSSLRKKYRSYMSDNEMLTAQLNLPGVHYYIKVLYEHDNGFLPFVNFVLVDFKDNASKLDSLIYQDRLELIKENKEYIMQLERYKRLVGEVQRDQPCLNDQQLHEVINHYISIVSLLCLNIRSSNKGVGNELKRKVKALVIFQKYYVVGYDPLKNINTVVKEVKRLFGFDSDNSEIITEFKKMYNSVSDVMEKNIRELPKIRDFYTKEELMSSFGIPKEHFGYRRVCERRSFYYSFQRKD